MLCTVSCSLLSLGVTLNRGNYSRGCGGSDESLSVMRGGGMVLFLVGSVRCVTLIVKHRLLVIDANFGRVMDYDKRERLLEEYEE